MTYHFSTSIEREWSAFKDQVQSGNRQSIQLFRTQFMNPCAKCQETSKIEGKAERLAGVEEVS